jgi:hypothetical protein
LRQRVKWVGTFAPVVLNYTGGNTCASGVELYGREHLRQLGEKKALMACQSLVRRFIWGQGK